MHSPIMCWVVDNYFWKSDGAVWKRKPWWRRIRSLVTLLFAGLVGAAFYINWINRTADWVPVYKELMAAGQCERAESLVTAAYLESDPMASEIQADWYGQGLCGVPIDAAHAQQIRAWGRELSAMATPYPNLMDRQLERLNGLLNHRAFRVQGAPAGFEWRDTYLWASCVERFKTWDPDPHALRLAIAQAQGNPFKRPTRRERAKASCTEKIIRFAQDLENGTYGDQARAEAEAWYMNAAVLGSDEAQLTLNVGRLEGRFPLFVLHEEDALNQEGQAEARRSEIENIFALAFIGYGPAVLVAVKLALAGEADHMFEGLSDTERDEAIYSYVLIAQYRGEDVSGVLTQAASRLTGSQRVGVENRLAEATSVLD